MKTRPTLFWLTLAWTLLGAAGCGDPCVAYCNDAKECPDADVSVNCEDLCATQKANGEAQNCLAEYDDLIECQTSLDDVCTPGDQCTDKQTAYDDCVAAACADDPTIAGCP